MKPVGYQLLLIFVLVLAGTVKAVVTERVVHPKFSSISAPTGRSIGPSHSRELVDAFVRSKLKETEAEASPPVYFDLAATPHSCLLSIFLVVLLVRQWLKGRKLGTASKPSELLPLLARGLGLMLYLAFCGIQGRRGLGEVWQDFPASVLMLGLGGAWLILSGGRIMPLLLTAWSGTDFLCRVASDSVSGLLEQQAAEYTVLAALPVLLVLVKLAGVLEALPNGTPVREEARVVRLFRLTALLTLFMVSFHKMNSDFLNPSVSCEEVVRPLIAQNWRLGNLEWLDRLSSPWLVILMEGPVPILLLLLDRRLGLLAVTLFFGGVSLVDALVVTLCVIVPALAFLEREDIERLHERRKSVLAVWLGLTAVLLPLSYALYQGKRLWYQFAMH
jgi:hypothetical protein